MELFFRRTGQGYPLVILHGLFGISDNWVTIGKRLAERFEVFIPDLRNHGQSPHSMIFTIPALVEDLSDFCSQNGLKKIILMGHSLGGLTAMHYALRFPGSVEKLIIVDISLRRYRNFDDHQQLINAMLGVDFSTVSKRSDVEKQLMKTVRSERLRQFLLKNVYWRDKENLDWRLNLAALNDNLPLAHEPVPEGNVFTGPAIFIRGGLSDYVRDDDFGEIQKKFPHAKLVTIPNATHWVHADAPEEFLRVVEEFMMGGKNS